MPSLWQYFLRLAKEEERMTVPQKETRHEALHDSTSAAPVQSGSEVELDTPLNLRRYARCA